MTPRKYELKQRAEGQAETRQRIVDAVVALHSEIGPAQTTISAIAKRAGVERLTVYRHFADERALYAACSAQFVSEAGPPDPNAWINVPQPIERLRAALLAFYAYYGRGEDMLSHVTRDARRLPELAASLAPWLEFVAATRQRLVRGWKVRGRQRLRLSAIVAHALRFETWQSLTREEALADGEAADLMVALAVAVTQPVSRHRGRRTESDRGRGKHRSSNVS